MPEPTAPTKPIVLRVQGSAADYAWPEASDSRLAGLSRLRVGRMRVTIEARQALRLPTRAESTIRGCLGWALLDAEAIAESADRSLLDELFGSETPEASIEKRLAAGAPRPLIVEADGRNLKKGERFDAELVLIGPLLERAEALLQALAVTCERGLGVSRVACRLVAASLEPAAVGVAGRLFGEPVPPSDVRVVLLTPLRVKAGGRFAVHLPFETLARAVFRRTSDLVRLYGIPPEPLAWPFADLVAESRQVRMVAHVIENVKTRRYSRRQGRPIETEGLIGSVTYRGPWASIASVLELASVIHVGHGASWGLGRVAVNAIPRSESEVHATGGTKCPTPSA
jgi:hypothetical protein